MDYCSICQENTNTNESEFINVFKCIHKFHKKCILEYLNINELYSNYCPLCRETIDFTYSKEKVNLTKKEYNNYHPTEKCFDRCHCIEWGAYKLKSGIAWFSCRKCDKIVFK